MIDVKELREYLTELSDMGVDRDLPHNEAIKLLDALEEQEAIIQDLREELRPERTAEYEAQLFHARLVEANKALEAADDMAKTALDVWTMDTATVDLIDAIEAYRAARDGK